jgi:hypothetical protein
MTRKTMRHVDTPTSICRLGLARCDITPPVGIYHRMWGAATHERATGVHRPLTATALVIHAEGRLPGPDTEQVIIALDHCLLWARDMDNLLNSVSRQTGLARQQLAFAFSHTHGAGMMDSSRINLPGGELIPPYLDALTNKVSGIVQQARSNVQPVTISYATGRCTLATHRDFWDEVTGQFVCGFNPNGTTDDSVLIARVNDETGRTLAVIVNYACHPTTLAWENTLISPDYVGALREVVEQSTGAACVFLQGASGDIGPREGFVGDTAVADRNGRQLGHAVLAALEALPPPAMRFCYAGPVVSGATLGPWKHVPLEGDALEKKAFWRLRRWTVDLPYRPELPTVEGTKAERARWQAAEQAALKSGDTIKARDCHAMVERHDRWLTRLAALPPGKDFPFPIVLWQIGDAFWLAVEAEHYNIFQRELRAKLPGVPLVIATIVNGSLPTYLPSKDVYGKGIYQESVAVVAPGCLERLIDEIGKQLGEWTGRPC